MEDLKANKKTGVPIIIIVLFVFVSIGFIILARHSIPTNNEINQTNISNSSAEIKPEYLFCHILAKTKQINITEENNTRYWNFGYFEPVNESRIHLCFN